MTNCDYCGLRYEETYKPDVKQHSKVHGHVEETRAKIGFFYTYDEREALKREFYEQYPSSNKADKIDWAIKFLQQYYSRSLESSGFSSKHPCFEDYAGMMLYQTRYKEDFSDVYEGLVLVYKPHIGINERESYF